MGCCFSNGGYSREEGGDIELQFDDSPAIIVEDKSTCGLMSMYMEDKNCLTSDGEGKFAAAMAPVCLEQDKSYWEIHVTHTGDAANDAANDFMLYAGVCKKNDISKTAASLKDPPESFTDPLFIVSLPGLKKNDTIGLCFDQSDLPMLTFRINDEITSHHITRVRGAVFPFVAFSAGNPDKGATTTAVSMVFKGARFRSKMPTKFDTVLAASNLL